MVQASIGSEGLISSFSRIFLRTLESFRQNSRQSKCNVKQIFYLGRPYVVSAWSHSLTFADDLRELEWIKKQSGQIWPVMPVQSEFPRFWDHCSCLHKLARLCQVYQQGSFVYDSSLPRWHPHTLDRQSFSILLYRCLFRTCSCQLACWLPQIKHSKG